MTGGDLPVVDGPFDGRRGDVTVSAVVLAAGTSSRFGEANKLLATMGDEPLVRRAVESMLGADPAETVVVVGHEAAAVQSAVSDLPVRTVENPDYADGRASSVRRGIAAVDDDADAALFALGDMPDVASATVRTLLDAFAAGAGNPLAAACDGRRGNPVVFGREYFDRLATIDGDTGGRAVLLDSDEGRLVETGDPAVLCDVDRPEDLRTRESDARG